MHRISMFFLLPLFATGFAMNGVQAADPETNPYQLSLSANQQRLYQLDDDHDFIISSPDKRPYARQIAFAAQASGLDPELVHAVIAVESAYKSAVVSPKGAVGLMQVLPQTAHLHGVRNLVDVTENLRAGTRHLSLLMEHFDNRLDLVLAAYNAGEGAVRRYNNSIPPFPETRNYVPAVVARYRANRPHAGGHELSIPASQIYMLGTKLEPRVLQQLR